MDANFPPPDAAPRRDAGTDGATATRAVDALAHDVERALEERGLTAAMALLNGRTRFRYTGVYRADPPRLRNICLFDRENPGLNVSGATTPLETTYCSITCATDAPFSTPDAGADERLAMHPARESVISYGGVPLRFPGGRAWGTLCHFDVRPRLLPPQELKALELVAPLLARWTIARYGD